jgi:hypothetical protein
LETIRAQIVNTRVYFSDLLIAPIHLLASYSSAAAVSVAAGTKASIPAREFGRCRVAGALEVHNGGP